MANILLIDDDKEFCQLLKEFFHSEDMSVSIVNDGISGIETIKKNNSDVVVLDIMMPPPNGIEVLKEVRKSSNIPIIMLTARGEDIDRIVGLELGADDYLAKPCNPRELLARINAVLRRVRKDDTQSKNVINIGDISLSPGSRKVIVKEEAINLTSTQFSILEELLKNAGNVISKEAISKNILGRRLDAYDRSVDMHVSNIRKILKNKTGKQYIKTIRNVGYLFVIDT